MAIRAARSIFRRSSPRTGAPSGCRSATNSRSVVAPMRHPRSLGPLLALAGIALALTSRTGAGAAKEDARITVILSQDAGPYQEALAGFRRYLEEQGVGAQIDVQALH